MEPDESPDILDLKHQFDEERRSAITSTDVAAILGLSKWATALSVYQDKVGESEERPVTLPMWMGNRMEAIVSELYCEATGNKVRADNRFHRHPQYPWLATHLDRRVVSDPGHIVELKTRDRMRGWGDDGSADIPVDTWAQVQTQMIVTGAREVHVAVLFGSRAFRVYSILPDSLFESTLIPELTQFWFENVLKGIPPPPSGRTTDTRILNGMPGGNTGSMKSATPEMEEVVQRLRLARISAAQADLAETEAANRVKVLIGDDADGLTGSFGTISWKRTAEIHKTAWRDLAGVYRETALKLLEKYLPDDPDVANARFAVTGALNLFTRTEPGVRRFEPKFREE
jgi:putative phage-type endonuclease